MPDKTPPASSFDDARAKRQAESERRSLVMWGYVTGAITWLSYIVGLEPSFIPLGFGVLGCIIAWQLNAKGQRRSGLIAGIINLAGIMVWVAYNWTRLRGWLGG